MCGWMLNLFVFFFGLPLLLRFGSVCMDFKVVGVSSGCVVAFKDCGHICVVAHTPLTIPSGECRHCWRPVPLTVP